MRTDERGQVTVLVLGFTLVAFAIAGVAVDGTRAFLHRRTLQSAADAAVLEAAVTFDLDSLYRSAEPKVDTTRARSAIVRSLVERGLTVVGTSISITEGRVVLVVRDRMPVSFLSLVGIRDIPIVVEAAASSLPRD